MSLQGQFARSDQKPFTELLYLGADMMMIVIGLPLAVAATLPLGHLSCARSINCEQRE